MQSQRNLKFTSHNLFYHLSCYNYFQEFIPKHKQIFCLISRCPNQHQPFKVKYQVVKNLYQKPLSYVSKSLESVNMIFILIYSPSRISYKNWKDWKVKLNKKERS